MVGARIKELREAAGLSANALAKKAGVAQSTLSEVESGKYAPKLDFIEKICKALNITLADFFSDETSNISPDLAQLLNEAESLTPDQRKKLIEFIRSMKY